MRICLILLFICPVGLIAQQVIDMDQFFEWSMRDHASDRVITEENIYFPWIEEVQLRTETRDFELKQQEYTIRVSPSTPRKRKAQKELYQHLLGAQNFTSEEYYCDQLEATYQDWIELVTIQNELEIFEEYEDIWSDRKTIQRREEESLDYDVARHVKWQSEYSKFLITKNELKLRKKLILEEYGISDLTLDLQDQISIDGINLLLSNDTIKLVPDIELRHKQKLIEKELELEKAAKNQLLDFAQIRYQGPHDDLIGERISVGVGVRLPTSGKNKLKIQELIIEKQEVSDKLDVEQKIKMQKLLALKRKILSDVQNYMYYSEVIEEERNELVSLSQRVGERQGFSPFLLLEIEEIYIQQKIKKNRMKEEIFLDYIDYLSISEYLYCTPFINFLK